MTESNKPPVTVRDIAKALGLHHTTVSMGLRNSPKLRPDTSQKIRDTAQRLGYTPDPMLSALNAYRQSKRPPHYQATLAWVNNWPVREDLLKIANFHEYYAGACDRGKQLGYAIEEVWLQEPGMSADRIMGILKARSIQGLLIAPQPHAGTPFPIDYRGFSAVAFGYSLQPAVLNVVTNHHFHSISLLISHLLEMGYRRIGFNIWMDWDEKVENAFLGGLKLALSRHPEMIEIPPCGIEKMGGLDLASWLKKYKPDVVVSHNELINILHNLGYSIPEDIGFASLTKDPHDESISGLNENAFYTGQKAVDILVGLLHRGERGVPAIPTRLLVESTWVPGTTLRRQDVKSAPKKKLSPRNQRPKAGLKAIGGK